MSRRDNAAVRCSLCRMHQSVCVCALVRPVAVAHPLVVVMHVREARKTTNTGSLAARCVLGARVVVRGDGEAPTRLDVARPVVLFPSEDATVLTPEVAARGPVTLVVPDGTWRQASRVPMRVAGLEGAVRVRLPPGPTSRYRLRAEPHADGLATAEAVARAYTILGEPDAAEAIERAFVAMVERTLWVRGLLPDDLVTGGLPPGVQRHDPRSGA